MKEKIDLSLNRSLPELESSYWEFLEATEGEDSSEWNKSVQVDLSALNKCKTYYGDMAHLNSLFVHIFF
jgi:hypothetical protein